MGEIATDISYWFKGHLKPIFIESDTTLPIIGDVIFKFILGKGNSKHNQEKYQSCLFEKKKWYVHQYMYYLLNFCYIYIIIQWKEIW